jgi:hypothetical protein
MISMALQDIEQGRGLLFIDPHVDAIRDILARIPPHRLADIILLDPSEDKYAFGINVLDQQNENIDDTFNRTKALFSKLYGDPQTGRLDVLLNQYLDNTIYPLIGQPGTTLLDIEPFVEDKSFGKPF